MSKVVLIDGSVLSFRSIFNWSQLITKQKQGLLIPNDQLILPSHYTYMSMIISVLKKVMVHPDDIIILALDGVKSWRKAFYPEYKAQRQEQREKATEVDWFAHWKKIDEVNEKLNQYSQINVIKLESMFSYQDLINSDEGVKYIEPDSKLFSKRYGIEGDDIIAVASQFYKDRDCVVVTIDKDLYQLDYFDNVKIFSMNLKTPKGKNGAYVVDCDPLKILNDKCRLGDVSDNIIIDKNMPDKDADVRRFIIDCLNTPTFLKDPIFKVLQQIKPKQNVIEHLPFYKADKNSLAHRFLDIYTDKNLVSYDYCLQYFAKKKEKIKKEKKEKAELKKLNKAKV